MKSVEALIEAMVKKPFEAATLIILSTTDRVPRAASEFFEDEGFGSGVVSAPVSLIVGSKSFGRLLTVEGRNREVVVVDEEVATTTIADNRFEASKEGATSIKIFAVGGLTRCDKLLACFGSGIGWDKWWGSTPNPLGVGQAETAEFEVRRVPAPRGRVAQGCHGGIGETDEVQGCFRK